MARSHASATPAGVLSGKPPVLSLFVTDVVLGVLYIDERAGLGILSAATLMMNVRTRKNYRIIRVRASEIDRVRKSGWFRRELLKRAA